MDPKEQLRFAINDQIDDQHVGPSCVPLSLLGDFQKDVSEFLRGSSRELDPAKVLISIEDGSLAFVASGLLSVVTLWRDLGHLERNTSLEAIDPKRAAVVARWQSIARSHPTRQYKLTDGAGQTLLDVDAGSGFKTADDVWVQSEKYVHGKITDMGGKTKPNIHIEMDRGHLMRVAASRVQLAEGDKNRMYRHELLHVFAEENLITGELRNISLIGFQAYAPEFDEEEFRTMVRRGTKAWADADNDWLEKLRGGGA